MKTETRFKKIETYIIERDYEALDYQLREYVAPSLKCLYEAKRITETDSLDDTIQMFEDLRVKIIEVVYRGGNKDLVLRYIDLFKGKVLGKKEQSSILAFIRKQMNRKYPWSNTKGGLGAWLEYFEVIHEFSSNKKTGWADLYILTDEDMNRGEF